MADIFVSYTSSDRDWAFWIGQELEGPERRRLAGEGVKRIARLPDLG